MKPSNLTYVVDILSFVNLSLCGSLRQFSNFQGNYRSSYSFTTPKIAFYRLHRFKITQIRVGLSKLKFHKFSHNFRDTIDPMCPTNDGIEDTEHFLLLCPSFDIQRRDLLAGVLDYCDHMFE